MAGTVQTSLSWTRKWRLGQVLVLHPYSLAYGNSLKGTCLRQKFGRPVNTPKNLAFLPSEALRLKSKPPNVGGLNACLFRSQIKPDEHTSYANELGVELKSLPVRSPSELMGSLGSLFAASLSRPDMAKYHGKPVKDAIQYAAEFHINLAELDRAAAKQWYISSILPLLPAMCEEKLARSNITESPTHLITVASPNPETIRTTVATFGITDCLILHTPEPDMKKHAKKALEYCNELQMNGSRCKASLVPININVDVTDQEQYRRQLSKNFLKAVEHFIRPCPPEYLAIDLTPGFFTIKVVLMEAIAQEKNILIYMRHKWTKVSGIVGPRIRRVRCMAKRRRLAS